MDRQATFGTATPLVGMVHLPALPGAPGNDRDRAAIRDRARRDATKLVDGGMDAVLVENFGDVPYHPESVPHHVVADLAVATRAVVGAVDAPVGVNVLRNDAPAAVSVAGATGGRFVRVNVHAGVRATDQGLLAGRAHETLRLRERVDADVAILADVAVKHSAPVADQPLARAVADLVDRGLADGLVVTGRATGAGVATADLTTVLDARDDHAPDVPVLVGSGVTPDTVADLLGRADGAIVGSALAVDGEAGNPVDPARIADLVSAAGR